MTLERFVMLAVTCLLAAGCLVIFLRGLKTPKETAKPAQPKEPEKPPEVSTYIKSLTEKPVYPSYRENDNLIWVEHVVTDIERTEAGFKASAQVQAQLLATGDVLRSSLPDSTRDCLGRLISFDRLEWLAQGDRLENITPERARAATAVAAASQAIWTLLFEFGCRADKFSYRAAIDSKTGVIIAGNRTFLATHITNQIVISTGVNDEMSAEIWCRIIYILENNISVVPGIGVKRAEEVVSPTAEAG